MGGGTGQAAEIARPADVTCRAVQGRRPRELRRAWAGHRKPADHVGAALYASPIKRPVPQWNRPSDRETRLVRVHKGVFFTRVARAERHERDERQAHFAHW